MKINLSNPNPPTKFFFDEEDHSRGWVELRICAPEEMGKIDKQTIKKRNEYRRGQRYEIEDINEKARNRLLWDVLIYDWGGIVDENDKQIKCTTENKVMLMDTVAKFAMFVGIKMDELTEGIGDEAEEQEKNSSSTQNDCPTRLTVLCVKK